jgi:hypothetical protein
MHSRCILTVISPGYYPVRVGQLETSRKWASRWLAREEILLRTDKLTSLTSTELDRVHRKADPGGCRSLRPSRPAILTTTL